MRILASILLLLSLGAALAQPVVIGHAGLRPLDRTTLERIYTGRIVEIDGVRLTPVNLPQGNALREAFLQSYLLQDENKYTGYWTVRRYVGKGTPPAELPSSAEVLDFVSKTEGAIGYVDSAKVPDGVQILLRGR